MSPSWDLHAERETLAYVFRRDFWSFLLYGWGVKTNPKGTWLDPYVDYPLARFLEVQGRRWLRHRRCLQGRKIMVVAPRDTAKTVKITKAFNLWLHLQDPNLAVSIGSADEQRSLDFLSSIKAVMDGKDGFALFAPVFGSWKDPARPWREDRIVHAQRQAVGISEPSIGTFSVETGATAYHPDVVIIDDPITIEKLSESGSWIERVRKFLIAMIPVLRKDGLTIYVGTPYEDGDAITTLLRDEGVRTVYGQPLPFEYMEGGEWHVFYLPGKSPSGQPNYPKVWTKEKMAMFERRSPMDFSAQVLCNPLVGEHIPLDRATVERMWVERQNVPGNLQYSIHLDTAMKRIEQIGRGDYSSIVVAGHTMDGSGEVYYERALFSNRWKVNDFLDALARVILSLQKQVPRPYVRVMTDEHIGFAHQAEAWGMQIKSHLANLNLPCPRMEFIDRSKGKSKPERLREVTGYWLDGKVKLIRGNPGLDRLVSEMLRMGKPHDDVADPAADAFHPLVYRPMVYRGDGDRQTNYPMRPFDDVLQATWQRQEEDRLLNAAVRLPID